MGAVKIISGPVEAPKPQNKAVIQGQGSIPYAKATKEKTPNIGKVKNVVWVPPNEAVASQWPRPAATLWREVRNKYGCC